MNDPATPMDLVVATPVFLDLTFVGLDGLPVLGEELFAADLMQTPGGGAITAIGAARLGLSTAIAAPLGRDAAGDIVRAVLAVEGVELVERSAARTPTTVVFPVTGDRGCRQGHGECGSLDCHRPRGTRWRAARDRKP